MTAFDFSIDFSSNRGKQLRVVHYGCQDSSLSNMPVVHHKFFSLHDTRSSVVVLPVSDLPSLTKDMKRCLFDLEKCRRGITGLLLILPT